MKHNITNWILNLKTIVLNTKINDQDIADYVTGSQDVLRYNLHVSGCPRESKWKTSVQALV